MSCPFKGKSRKISKDNDEDNWLTYDRYLCLDKLLSCQQPHSRSKETSEIVHEEMLFIITHQAFELWFKQILFEIDSMFEIFRENDNVQERNMIKIISRLNRIVQILKLINGQFAVLETMTARQFYDFRNFLEDASGFQSLQFRLLEIRLGVKEETRISVKGNHYSTAFIKRDRDLMEKYNSEMSLFDYVNDWLSRTPGIEEDNFKFIDRFRGSVESSTDAIKERAETKIGEEKTELLDIVNKTKDLFKPILCKSSYEELLARKDRSLSYKAMQGALMILTYNEEPRFHVPYQVIQTLMELDSQFCKFRFNHTCMVQKMIGTGSGSYGSSGYQYLKATCGDRYKVFIDFSKLSGYLIPKQFIPALPKAVERRLSVHDFERSSENEIQFSTWMDKLKASF